VQVVDLIEVHRAARRQLQLAELRVLGVREGALLMTEQLGLEQLLGIEGQCTRMKVASRLGEP